MDPIRFLVRRLPTTLGLFLLAAGLAGCGTNLEQVLYQTLTAAGRTAVDIALTDLANDIADRFEDQEPSGDDVDGDGDDGDDGGNGGNGDSPTGAELFAGNCASCHGADGASGFAPDISGFAADELLAGLESGTHASITLTDEEVGMIAEFLGGSGGSNGGGLDGAALFAGTCAACHGPDGASGFAPNIRGYTTEQLLARPSGHVPISLTDDEIAAISAFLGGS